MKKAGFLCTAAAAVLLSCHTAQATTISATQLAGTTDISASPDGQGLDDVVNVVVKNTNNGTVTLSQIEVWFGGTGQAAGTNTPPTGFSYDLDATSLGDLSTAGSVAPKSGNPGDHITSAELVNDTSSGYCYIGESLAKGDTCDIELIFTAVGVAPTGHTSPADKGSSDTEIFTTVWASSGSENSAAFDLDTQYIPDAPEPGSLVLLGTGFGVLGLGIFLGQRRRVARQTIA